MKNKTVNITDFPHDNPYGIRMYEVLLFGMKNMVLPTEHNPARHLNLFMSEIFSRKELPDMEEAQKAVTLVMDTYNSISRFFMKDKDNSFPSDVAAITEAAVNNVVDVYGKKGLIELLHKCISGFEFILEHYEDELFALELNDKTAGETGVADYAELCEMMCRVAAKTVAELSEKGKRAAAYRHMGCFILANLIMLTDIANSIRILNMPKPVRQEAKKDKIGRNEPCSCGSGLKYKKCCGKNDNVVYLNQTKP